VTGRPTSPGDLTSAEHPIVLVIDDDESMRRGLTNLFESVGLRVEVFRTAPELLRSKLPDVASSLVLGIRLPGLSGLDFHHRPRSGWATDRDAGRARWSIYHLEPPN
jgi:CheY-like chemotaxis protein